MKSAWNIVFIILSIFFLIFRIARCSKSMEKQAAKEYVANCQAILDSADIIFEPIAQSMMSNENIDEEVLTHITARFYDMAKEARMINAYKDEAGVLKNNVVNFIEFERGLTCCYLKRYYEELSNSATAQTGTISNLKNWIGQYNNYQRRNGEDYVSGMGYIHLNYRTNNDFSQFRDRLEMMALKATSPQ